MRAVVALLALAVGTASSARAAEPISWEEADRHVGEVATVEGRVMGIHCSPISCLIAFDPSFNRFTAVIQAAHFDVFPPDQLDRVYSGRRVMVHGTIRTIDNKPEIEVEKADDLRVVTTKTRAERDAAHAEEAEVQAEIADRLGEVLARMDELAEKLAALQERMEVLFAHLDERTAAIAAAQPVPAPPPPAPSYGEPQPRPGFEALRSLKRGMSRADVQRLAGQPLQVEATGTGAETWYYGYGRSISFDPRGRVQGLSGFPRP